VPISLIELPDGEVSLELGDCGPERLAAEAIAAQLGPLATLERAALYDVVVLGGERLLYYHEWDPCLLSTSPQGARLLRRLYQVLAAKGADRG
jgi:hypothetical protein